MKNLVDAWISIRAYADAHFFIIRHRLWRYVILPGILNLVLFISTLYLAWVYSGELTGWLLEDIQFVRNLIPAEMDGPVEFLILWGIRIFMIMMYLSIYKYIILILMAPVLSMLGDKSYTLLTGKKPHSDFKSFLFNVFRGLSITVRNLMLEIFFSALLFFIGFIPIVNLAVPLLMFFMQAYFYGFSMLDYANERNNLSVRASINYIRNNKGLAIGNGMGFFFLFSLPFIGWMLAPAYGVIAATLSQTTEKHD